MSKERERRATDGLNVALSGIEAVITLLEQKHPVNDKMVEKLRHYADEARQHLITIQFNLKQL